MTTIKITATFGANNPICLAALAIRKTVFVSEQNISLTDELDNLDATTWHYVAFVDHQPIATARVLPEKNNQWHIQRVATLKAFRHQGIASAIIKKIIADANTNNITQLTLGAQLTAKEFYQTLGFSSIGPEFIDANIRHVTMIKKI